jgi:TPR repeat protein
MGSCSPSVDYLAIAPQVAPLCVYGSASWKRGIAETMPEPRWLAKWLAGVRTRPAQFFMQFFMQSYTPVQKPIEAIERRIISPLLWPGRRPPTPASARRNSSSAASLPGTRGAPPTFRPRHSGIADRLPQHQLSLIYLHNREEQSLARQWCNAAAAERNVALLVPNGPTLAPPPQAELRGSRGAAEQGLADAQADLDFICARKRACAVNYAEARHWHELAACRGNVEALFNLGMLYAGGCGDEIDFPASAYYSEPADKNYGAVELAFGLMYLGGQGIGRDAATAAVLFKRAADRNTARARCLTARSPLLRTERPVQPIAVAYASGA